MKCFICLAPIIRYQAFENFYIIFDCGILFQQYAFNMLQHLVTDHQVKLCSAEIMYSCDVCSFKCSSYIKLEVHLNTVHPKTPVQNAAAAAAAAAVAAAANNSPTLSVQG